MSFTEDVQKLEPGTKLEFYEMDATSLGAGMVRFQGFKEGVVVWQGNEYNGWPISAEGFSLTSGQQPTPKLSVANVDGSITLLCAAYDDFIGAKLTRRQTFAHYLDGQPGADPTQERVDVYYIERKASETRESVAWELSTPADFQGTVLPRRQIIQNQCPFVYRGEGCAYAGPPVATALGIPTSDPSQDRCGKRLEDCELRQWADGVKNFGGFPAAGLVRS